MKSGTYPDVRDVIESNCHDQDEIDAAMMQIEYLEYLARQVTDAPSFETWLKTCRSDYARRLRRRLARRQQGAA